jgi:outer membrane lipoprotein SlyB
MENNHAMAQPGMQPSFSDKVRHSKALIPTLAVMLVAVGALATTLVVTRTGAQDGVPDGPAPVAQVAPTQKLVQAPAKAPVKVVQQQPKPVTVARAVCGNCGVVESSVAVQRQGQVNGIANTGIGVGAVGGAVVGGLLGNQVGKGSGRTAATVLGAAGGAYAGNAIEKNYKKVTVYQMRIRMNDGSYRTIEQGAAIPAGSSVVVEGNTARVATSNG